MTMENTINHPNSRKVHIKRSLPFIARAQGKGAENYYSSGVQSIGSYFESSTKKRVASGLTITEEKILMPDILGMHSDDREYFKERNKYWAAFETKVPGEDGIELEVGLETSNDKPLSKENLPINLIDYLRYRHAIGHPWVATSLAKATGNQMKHFYLFDQVADSADKSTANDARDKALTYYLKVKDNPEKVNMMLMLMGTDYRDLVGQNEKHAQQLRAEKLREYVNDAKETKKFVEYYEDKNFELRYQIEAMVKTGVIKKVGTRYFDGETNEPLGDVETVINFFKDEEVNSGKISILKSKMQEGLQANKRVKRSFNTAK